MSANANKSKKRKSNRKSGIVKLLIALIIVAVLSATAYTLSVTVFFNIKTITVKGDTQYSKEDILDASGISEGMNMNMLSPEDVEAKICGKLPYVGQASVKRKYPDSVEITVKGCKPNCAYKFKNSYILVYGDKALDKVSQKPKNLTIISAQISRYIIGQKIVLKEEMNETLDIIRNQLTKAGIKDITAIDVENVSEIEVTLDNKIILQIGSTENIEKKCKNAAKIVDAERKKYGQEVQGYVNLKYLTGDSNKSYFTRENIEKEDAKP